MRPGRGRAHVPATAIGVDIGGTKVLGVVVDEHGRILDTAHAETPDRADWSLEVVHEELAGVVRTLASRHGAMPVGIGAAGFVDHEAGLVRFAPHLPWREAPVQQRLQELLGHLVVGEVHVDNDANAALWAEVRFGAVREVAQRGGRGEDVVMITLGTGIGGALLLGGRLHRGRNGMAGELGHMRLVPDDDPAARPCECGGRGCWEQYASGRALARFAREHGSPLSGAALTAAARQHDPVALEACTEVGRWLGLGLADVVAALDPALVLVGGGVGAAGDLLLDPAREALDRHLVGRGHRVVPELLGAALGPAAGAIGAADLARTGI